MESPFLKERLPQNEQETRTHKPSLPSKILGALFVAIVCVLITVLFYCLILPALILTCLWPSKEDSLTKFSHRLWVLASPLLFIVNTLYSIFAGLYVGYKYGLTESRFLIANILSTTLRPLPPDFGTLKHFPSLEDYTFPSPAPTVANIALDAQRLKQKETIFKLQIDAISLPTASVEKPSSKSERKEETMPLIKNKGTPPASSSSYGSGVGL